MNNSSKKVIAVCLSGTNDNYQSVMISELLARAKQMKMCLLFFTALGDDIAGEANKIGENNIYYLINYKKIDGIILLSETIKDKQILEKIQESAQKENLPVVSIDYNLKGCYNILFEYQKAMEKIIRHFAENHRYRVFEYVAGIPGNASSEERLAVFREVMEEYDLTVEEERIHYGGYCEEITEHVMDEILSSKKEMPEAFICANDTMAMTVIRRLLKAGYRIPEQVAVSGFDGTKEGMNYVPSLTTACQDFKKAAALALDILFNVFHHITEKTMHYVPFKIRYGESCCPYRKRTQGNAGLSEMLYRRLSENERFTNAMVQMSAQLMECENIMDMTDRITAYLPVIHATEVWLCLIPEYRRIKEVKGKNKQVYYQSGYPGGMLGFIYKKDGSQYAKKPYAVSDMIPDLEENVEKEEKIFFLPLHMLDKAIGYMAVTFDGTEADYSKFYAFSMALSSIIESIRRSMEQNQKMEQMREKYSHDLLTGLLNRRGFFERVTTIYEECAQNEEHLMLISIDLDGLKYINDTFGHAEGDRALVAISQVLKSISQKDEICARFGGDEFIVAGRIPNDIDYIKEYNKRLKTALRVYNSASDKRYKIEASCGVFYDIPSCQKSVDDFIREADAIMYDQKEKNRKYRSYVRV